MILRKPPRTNSDSLRQVLSWTTLKARRHNAMLSQVHCCVQGRAPLYLSSKFTLNSSFGYNGTRGASKLYLKQSQSQHYHTSFEFQGAMAYNRLPETVRSLPNVQAFRQAIAHLSCWIFVNTTNISYLLYSLLCRNVMSYLYLCTVFFRTCTITFRFGDAAFPVLTN